MSNVDTRALEYVFPAELLRYFSIVESGIKTDNQTREEYLEVVFEEQNELPEGYSREEYESKGFFSKRVQDFPLRGRAVFLELRRRRWRHKVSGEQITRDFTFLADGTTLTAELADFLKQRGR
jgi:hypothetical protein